MRRYLPGIAVPVVCAALLGLAAAFGLHAGSAGQWRQGPALALPYTAARVGHLRLILDDRSARYAGDLTYSLRCNGRGIDHGVRVSASIVGRPETMVASFSALACQPSRLVATGLLPQAQTVPVGATWQIALSYQPGNVPRTGIVNKVDRLFTMGTDGRLRAGAGSVWKSGS